MREEREGPAGRLRRPAGEASPRSHARVWTSPGGLDLGVPRMGRRDKKKGKQKLGEKCTRDCQIWEAVKFHTARQVRSPLILKANPLVKSMIFSFLMIDFVYFLLTYGRFTILCLFLLYRKVILFFLSFFWLHWVFVVARRLSNECAGLVPL